MQVQWNRKLLLICFVIVCNSLYAEKEIHEENLDNEFSLEINDGARVTRARPSAAWDDSNKPYRTHDVFNNDNAEFDLASQEATLKPEPAAESWALASKKKCSCH